MSPIAFNFNIILSAIYTPVPNSESLDVKLYYFVIFSSTSFPVWNASRTPEQNCLEISFFLYVVSVLCCLFGLSASQHWAPGGASTTQLQFAQIAALLLLVLTSPCLQKGGVKQFPAAGTASGKGVFGALCVDMLCEPHSPASWNHCVLFWDAHLIPLLSMDMDTSHYPRLSHWFCSN